MTPPRPETSHGPRPGPPADAETLVPAVLAGDADALDAWYRTEHPRVWRLCTGLLASREEAEDAVQDALVKILDHLDRWSPERPYRAWTGRVVVNLCRDRQRRSAARLRAEAAAGEARAHAAAAAGLDPAEVAEREDAARLFERALGALSSREREAFVLCDLEGVGSGDAARAMEVAAGTVRTLLALARRRLREQLAAHVELGAEPGLDTGGSR